MLVCKFQIIFVKEEIGETSLQCGGKPSPHKFTACNCDFSLVVYRSKMVKTIPEILVYLLRRMGIREKI